MFTKSVLSVALLLGLSSIALAMEPSDRDADWQQMLRDSSGAGQVQDRSGKWRPYDRTRGIFVAPPQNSNSFRFDVPRDRGASNG